MSLDEIDVSSSPSELPLVFCFDDTQIQQDVAWPGCFESHSRPGWTEFPCCDADSGQDLLRSIQDTRRSFSSSTVHSGLSEPRKMLVKIWACARISGVSDDIARKLLSGIGPRDSGVSSFFRVGARRREHGKRTPTSCPLTTSGPA
jgi:hypothetical protein